jgi:hypothetical protein
MTVRKVEDAIALSGDCPVEDSEVLLALLIDDPKAIIDLDECGNIHTAVAQVLVAARREIRGVPADRLLADWILPQLLDPTRDSHSR